MTTESSTSTATAPIQGPSPFHQVPLNRRDGTCVWATVDLAEREDLEQFPWHESNRGYAVRTVDPATGEKESMARRIMGLKPGDGLEVDHISFDKLDNRRSNLRVCTHAENGQNSRPRKGATSRFRGVSRRKGAKACPWQAYGCVAGKLHHLGFFAVEQEAADAAAAFRAERMPFARD